MTISIDQFKQTEIKIGEILSAEKVPDTDKLLKLSVSFNTETRQVVSGIAEYFPNTEDLIGKKCAFVTNLEPRMIKGLESQAMILAAHNEDSISILIPDSDIPAGSSVV